MSIAVIGTDTGVGKTWVTIRLLRGLRSLGRRAWVHKPAATGDWDGVSAGDGRLLGAEAGDGQLAATICPWQFPDPASPHLAAAAAGRALDLGALAATIASLKGDHDLVVEGVGGLLVPLTPWRQTIADLLIEAKLPALIVTRPDLGTLNHTALTVEVARQRGIPLVGLVVNAAAAVREGLAARTAVEELAAITNLPIISRVPHLPAPDADGGIDIADLAEAVLAAHHAVREPPPRAT